MKTLLFILLLILILPQTGFGNEFDPYVASFMKAHPEYGHVQEVELSFGEVPKNPDPKLETAGECVQANWVHMTPVIRINENVWKRLPEKTRETLIWHELGHCVLGLQHSETGFMKPVLD